MKGKQTLQVPLNLRVLGKRVSPLPKYKHMLVLFPVLFLLGEVSETKGSFSSHWVQESLVAVQTESISRGEVP